MGQLFLTNGHDAQEMKKKTRRSQKKKNIWKNMKIMMVNIRGFKCKENSMKEIIQEHQPTILMLMETLCQKEDVVIEGYAIQPTKKRDDLWGGIMFAIKKELEHQVQIKNEWTEHAEILFVQATFGRTMATIGLVYAPQENLTTVDKMDKMYKYIEEEIITAKIEEHVVILGGDFNCRIGENIKDNKKEVTKGGRRLIKMAKNNGMTIINTTEKCEGIWTRTQKEKSGEKKSAIDYLIITEEHEKLVKNMVIDEEKNITPFRDDSLPGKPIYTDHNMITLNMNLQIIGSENDARKISRKKMEKFKEATESTQLTELVKKDESNDITEMYTKWNDKTLDIVKKTCGQKMTAKKELKEIRMMRRKRKKLKLEMRQEKEKTKIEIIKRRRIMIQQHIVERKKLESKQKVIQLAENIMCKGIFNRTAYWDFMRIVKSKKRMIKGRTVNDEQGNRINEPQKVRDRYGEFYKELLKTRKAETEDEKRVEETVDRCIETMLKKAENIQIQPMSDHEYDEMKRSLKEKKAQDLQGWFYEIIVYAGKDLEESIKLMINMILRTKAIPEEWNVMGILPIDKTTGWLEMKNKRGLFLTNIVSKCVEKILFKRRENALKENLSPFQSGGMIERAIQDNLFIVNHIVHKYKKENKNLYLLFSDIEKCFDNLWLKDCILELIRSGTPIEEAMFIYQMNKNMRAIVRTPVGDTEEIHLEEIVRQGTVGGNKLCIVSTDRINRMGSYLEKDGIRYPIFVDDKIGVGDPDTIKEMNWKMNTLETTKKYKYNTKKGKTEWMMIRNNKRKNEEIDLELKVRSGRIGRTTQYKYVGDMYDEKGTNMSKIKYKEDNIDIMISNVKKESSEKKIGKAALTVRLMLVEVVITPTVLSSTETWHNITKQEEQQINKIHHKILTKTLHLPRTTPYLGIVSELNIFPFMDNIWYKKFMWYHRLMNSGEERQARKKLREQMEDKDNWYSELKHYADTNGINIDQDHIMEVSYYQYKCHVKEKIRKKIVRKLSEEKKNKTKLRWISPGKVQEYTKQCSIREASSIMKVRLHMARVKANYGGGFCRKCEMVEETTEHVLQCETDGEIQFESELVEDVGWLRRINRVFKQFEE